MWRETLRAQRDLVTAAQFDPQVRTRFPSYDCDAPCEPEHEAPSNLLSLDKIMVH